MARAWLLLSVTACYAPTAPQGAPCSISDECPAGQACRSGLCSTEKLPADAGSDGMPDAPAADAMVDANTSPVPDAPMGMDPWGTIPGLVARYPMNDVPALTGSVACSDPQAVGSCVDGQCPAPVMGVEGSAYEFSGSERAVIMQPSLLSTAPYTVSLWVWIDPDAPDYSLVFAKPASSSSNLNSFGFGLNNFQLVWETNDGSYVPLLAPAGFEPRDGWHHYALHWNGNRKRLYIDGTLTTDQTTTLVDSSLPFSLGSDVDMGFPSSHFVGRVDELRIYNRALAAAEIAALATSSGP